jgi:DNA-binding transcriptional LysR family regulator
MAASIQPSELPFLVTLSQQPSLTAAARELGLGKAAVSKRLAQIELRAGVMLVNRSTRRMAFTAEGEAVVEKARSILAEMDELGSLLRDARQAPTGLLRVNATLGFGRRHIAPLISSFVRLHPDVQVQLQLSASPPPDDAYDVCIRFGPPPESRLVARRIAANRRLLCASPTYLRQAGTPNVPADLLRHACIGIRQGDEAYGVLRLSTGKGASMRTETIKTRGKLTTNDGEIAVAWALDGHGILLRAEWDIDRYLKSGRLVQLLPQWRAPEADIYAVYPQQLQLLPRVQAFVAFVAKSLV